MSKTKLEWQRHNARRQRLLQRRNDEAKRRQNQPAIADEKLSDEQILAAIPQMLTGFNAKATEAIRVHCPENLPLVGKDYSDTYRAFSDAGKSNLLKDLMAPYRDELVGSGLLGGLLALRYLAESNCSDFLADPYRKDIPLVCRLPREAVQPDGITTAATDASARTSLQRG